MGFKALADAMSDGKVFATICSDDVSAQMTQLGQMVLTAMGH